MRKSLYALITLMPLGALGAAGCDGAPPNENVELTTGALSVTTVKLLPFGGRNDSGRNDDCVGVATDGSGTLRIALCNDFATTQNFFIDTAKLTISPDSDHSQCLSLRNGDLVTGTIDMEPCNGTLNQQWVIVGGQIQTANRADNNLHCIGPHFGLDTVGNVVDLGGCNNSQGQSFWITGMQTTFMSSFTDTKTPPTPECLHIKNSNIAAGAGFDDNLCNYGDNGDASQVFILDTRHHVVPLTNTNLCLTMGAISGGLASATLQTCSVPDASNQQFFHVAQNPGNTNGAIAALSNVNNATCIDVQFGNATPGTAIDAFTCNGTSAQRWQPRIGPTGYLQNRGGRVLASPRIFRLYHGTWWMNTYGQASRQVHEQYTSTFASYMSGVGAPFGEVPFLRQYGVMSASALSQDIVLNNDTLSRTTVKASSIANGTITLTSAVLTSAHRGGTVVITGASNGSNNRTFTIDTVPTSTTAHLVPVLFDTVTPQNETFTSAVNITVTRPGLLSNGLNTGGAQSIQSIVQNAVTSGLIPNDGNNLVYVFPSPDFTPDTCGASGFPAPDSHCDGISGNYHNALAGLPPYAVMFQKGSEPAVRVGPGISHEIIEAVTDPDIGRSDVKLTFLRSDGIEASDVCCQPLSPGACISALGIDISSGVDNRLGGSCSPNGYIPSP